MTVSEPTTVPDHSSRMAVQGIRVEVIRGPDQGRAHTAASNSITIGTAAGNDLRLSDETVSRYHVELTCRGDRIVVVDHGSTNGTAIGGAWITTGTVRPGTVLSLG